MIILFKSLPLIFLSMGVFLLMQVILPIISYRIWLFGQSYNNQVLFSPKQTKQSQVLGVSIQKQQNFPAFVSNRLRQTKAPYSEFTIDVPKLKIEKAKVFVDSNDLSSGLAHLPGAALPGEKGNVFISGHSALSRILNLKTALFANLTDLKIGDYIVVEANGAVYKYQVVSSKVVDPSEISVINAPEPQGRYISLMTCVPPGLNLKRLVILGKMV